jgi:hypothetical protein
MAEPGNKLPEATERANRLRSRLNELEQQLRQLHEQVAAEWSRFDEAQQTIPHEARLTYTSWYASIWGPKISIVQTELDNALAGWKLFERHTPQED